MTSGRLPDRDGADVEALIADHYLDALLAAADRRADDAPVDAALDPALRDAARALRRSLVRVHPSFRFEERLSARLAELAAAQSAPAVIAGGGAVVPFLPAGSVGAAMDGSDPLLDAILAGELDPAGDAVPGDARRPDVRRPLIVGGAITSAAISIVGVAWVAWRNAHPATRGTTGAMGRAARSAHARRLAVEALAGEALVVATAVAGIAAAVGAGTGIGGPA